ncbi:hypothetical protein MASR1M107_20380 [Ignavibacteriales bacterium]
MKTTKLITVIALFVAFALFPQSLVKTKAGILVSSGNDLIKLKSNSTLKLGDKYRILLQPDSGGYGYYVIVTGKSAKSLLTGRAYKNQILAYPGKGDFIKFPDKGNHQLFLIYSLKKITDLENLFKSKSEVKADDFLKIAGKIKKQIKQNVSDDSQVDIIIAGNARGNQDVMDKDFLQKVKPFATKDILLLEYKIKVK